MTTLEDDEAVVPGASPDAESRQGRARVEREAAGKGDPASRKRESIGSRVSDHEEDVPDLRVVPELEQHPPLDGLDVGQPRLDLESVKTPVRREDPVPCTSVGDPGKRNLRPKPGRRWESRAQAIEDAELPGVAYGVAVGVEADDGRQTDGHGKPTELLEAHVLEDAALEAVDLTRRDADRVSDVRATQARSDPRLPEVPARRIRQRLGCRLGAPHASFTDGHRLHVARRPLSRGHPARCYASPR